MDRRAFLNGLVGVAGAAALAGLTVRPANAAPIARALNLADLQSESPAADAGPTADGTGIEKVHWTGWRHGHGPRGYWGRRRRWRRRSRLVCRTYWRRGFPHRRCYRVYW